VTPTSAQALRIRLQDPEPLVVPGCYDAMSALLAQSAGFEAVLVSGFAVSASLLGVPDVELYTETEIVTVCRNICRRLQVPVMADADNGYGNAINVMRTVADFEQAGVSSVTLEDQSSPKSCPLLSGESDLVSIEEAVGKLKAAISVRRDPHFLVIARTDARDEAEVLRRAKAYAAAGADAIKLISPALQRIEFLRELKAACNLPIMIASLGWAASVEVERFRGLVSLITHPLMSLATSAAAVRANLQALHEGARTAALPAPAMKQHDLEILLGLDRIRQAEAAFLPPSRP